MQVMNAGTNDDGTPHDLVHAPGEHVLLTPRTLSGTVTLPDGTEVDVTARHLSFASAEEAQAVAAAIDAVTTENTDTTEES